AFAHARGELLHVRRADAVVDVAAVRLDRDRLNLGAEATEDLGRDAVRRSVRAVEQDACSGQVELCEARLELAQVVARRTVELAHAARRGTACGLSVGDTLVAARPSFSARSAVRNSPATPRTPSVPNSLRVGFGVMRSPAGGGPSGPPPDASALRELRPLARLLQAGLLALLLA